jgi:hypothetical protein
LSRNVDFAMSTPRGVSIDGDPRMERATGTFDVQLKPLANDPGADPGFGRMSLDKQFHGGLEGSSQGQMFTAMSPVQGSAGYVALERFTGALNGRKGTFVLQHSGTMTRGLGSLTIKVVPDSGTEDLAGLNGRLNIEIDAGNHSYTFEYSLPSLSQR